MNLFELFRQNQVLITPEVTVNVEYITVDSLAKIYGQAEGEILLVKRQITLQDVDWLQTHCGNYTVFTTAPKVLADFDAQNSLTDKSRIHLINDIGLNFLHYGEVLYAFADVSEGSPMPGSPNVVRVSPVRRSDVEMRLSINMEAFRDTLGISEANIRSEARAESENKPAADAVAVKKTPKEIDYVREELARFFADKYSVFRVRFVGTKPENRTVVLTKFYANNNIAKKKLRGTWSLFDKADIEKMVDVGIVERAKERALSKISASIPGYGTILRTEKVPYCRAVMEKIELDYKAYLNGKECTHVGEIDIKTTFSLQNALDNAFSELRDYLLSIEPGEKPNDKYEDAVEKFIKKEKYKCDCFSDSVKMKLEETAYKASQWESQDFISSLWEAVNMNTDFFDSDFEALLDRYSILLKEENQNQSDSNFTTYNSLNIKKE